MNVSLQGRAVRCRSDIVRERQGFLLHPVGGLPYATTGVPLLLNPVAGVALNEGAKSMSSTYPPSP